MGEPTVVEVNQAVYVALDQVSKEVPQHSLKFIDGNFQINVPFLGILQRVGHKFVVKEQFRSYFERVIVVLLLDLFEADNVGVTIVHAKFFSIVISHLLFGEVKTGLEMIVLLQLERVGEDVCMIGMDSFTLVLRVALRLEGEGRLHREVVVLPHEQCNIINFTTLPSEINWLFSGQLNVESR